MTIKQIRATKLLDDYYLVGSNRDTPAPLWHRRHHRWLQPNAQLAAAFRSFPHRWILDLAVIKDAGGDDVEVALETYRVEEPKLHEEVLDDFIRLHKAMLGETPDGQVLAVGWVLRVSNRGPSPALMMQLIGL